MKNMKNFTNEQLQSFWEQGFENRVKSGERKGQIKIKTIRFMDKVLAEASRRYFKLVTPAKYQ